MWPYMPTLARLALALAIGLFIGIERERRQKVAGVRTFAFAAVLGAVGGLLGEHFGLLAIGLLGVLMVLLNLDTLWSCEGPPRSPPPPRCWSPASRGCSPARATPSPPPWWAS